MTTFDVLESSEESSQPIEAFRFARGAQSWFYTSSEDEVVLGSETFLPTAIARGAIQQGGGSRTLTVTVPSDNEFVAEYAHLVPGVKATVTVIQLQRDEVPTFATQVVKFKGHVYDVRFTTDGRHAEIAVRSLEASGDQNMPRYGYGSSCQHALYGPGCDVDPTLHDHIGIVTAVSGDTITVAGAAASGHKFKGGYCRPTGFDDFRLITSQSGDVLTLLLPFSVDVLGLSMQAFAGCDHRVDGDCALVFDNVIESAAHAYVPNIDLWRNGLPV